MSKLELVEIRQNFGNNEVLRNINLTVDDGEFVTILGPSGSGKTTLFNIIGGVLVPTNGEVLLDGRKITHTRGHVTYMPQTPSLMPWRTVIENIELGQEIKGQVDRNNTLELLARCGFLDIKDQMPDKLSGGMRQRVSFVRALNSTGKLLLLDEPFSALDEITRIDMQEWLQEILAKESRTVLMITHSIEEAIKLSDKIVVLEGKPATVGYIYETSQLKTPEDAVKLRQKLLEILR